MLSTQTIRESALDIFPSEILIVGDRMLPFFGHTPKVLYKYFAAPSADEIAKVNLDNVLRKGLIRLTGADEVNDPFENEPMFVDQISPEDVYKHSLRAHEADLSVAPHLKQAQEALRKRFPTKLDLKKHKAILFREQKEEIPKVFRESLRKTPFCCLTERPDSQLMWSHYASSHRGICIGFRTTFGQFPAACVPVSYSPSRVAVKLGSYLNDWSNADVDKDIFKILTTKSADWSYEKEWRFIGISLKTMRRSRVGDCVDFDRAAIAEIIFGSRAEESAKEFVREKVADLDPQPLLFQASIAVARYGIDLNPM